MDSFENPTFNLCTSLLTGRIHLSSASVYLLAVSYSDQDPPHFMGVENILYRGPGTSWSQ